MNVTINPSHAVGTVQAPPSKSMAHRLLICAGLSDGFSRISGIELNEDIAATIDCLSALGATCTVCGDTVTVRGTSPCCATPKEPLYCRESGSTLRFFVPIALLSANAVTFTGTQKLLSRPLSVYAELCAARGLEFVQTADTVQVKGALKAGEFTVPGNISSQFITGLLLALPLLEGESFIHITPPIESLPYISLTLQALAAFGIHASWRDSTTLYVPGNQRYTARDMAVEGDYSGAAFLEAFNLFGGNVQVAGLSPDSLQGDSVYFEHFKSLANGKATIDITDCPDLGPILFAVAAAKNGGVFTGTKRLKIKESDRAAAMAKELAKFGTKVIVKEDTVTVESAAFHPPCETLCGHNDHRIVMSLAVLCSIVGGTIEGAQAVRKSFPDFFEKISNLQVEVIRDATE